MNAINPVQTNNLFAKLDGFSLVELMVVVAIIGILAAIGIPAMQKFVGKARQSEAKTNLSAIYTSEKSFFGEYSTYDTRFEAIGYVPEGRLHYNVGFSQDPTRFSIAGPENGFIKVIPISHSQALNFCLLDGAAPTTSIPCTLLRGSTNELPPDMGTDGFCGKKIADSILMFAGAMAIVTPGGVTDCWSVDDTKNFRNAQDGIQ